MTMRLYKHGTTGGTDGVEITTAAGILAEYLDSSGGGAFQFMRLHVRCDEGWRADSVIANTSNRDKCIVDKFNAAETAVMAYPHVESMGWATSASIGTVGNVNVPLILGIQATAAESGDYNDVTLTFSFVAVAV